MKFNLTLMAVLTPKPLAPDSAYTAHGYSTYAAMQWYATWRGIRKEEGWPIIIGGTDYNMLPGGCIGNEYFSTDIPKDGIVVYRRLEDDIFPGAIDGNEMDASISDLTEWAIVTAPKYNCTYSIRIAASDL